jgi:hypothetical protein
MQLFKFLKIIFRLPAALLCGITVASHHLYFRFVTQLPKIPNAFTIFFHQPITISKCYYSPFRRPGGKGLGGKCLFVFLLIIFTGIQKTNAQTADTTYPDSNYVDTVSMTTGNSSPVEYDDQDDGYVDTTVKHIYDTSQFFFNWKDYTDDPYTSEKIAQRHLIDADVKALKNDADFWYVPAIEKLETRLKNDPEFRDSLLNNQHQEFTDESQNGLLYQPWFNTLLWIIIIGIFAAAVIYFLIQNKINIFSRASASSAEDAPDEEGNDIFHLSYTKLILQAEKEKDYRVAIRLMFLQTLKLLSDTNIIHYQADYTDLHYLQQLNQSKYYNEFFTVMRSYEYAWYGKFNIPAERYTVIKNDFLKLQHKII